MVKYKLINLYLTKCDLSILKLEFSVKSKFYFILKGFVFMEDKNYDIGKQIRKIRTSKNITINQVAKETGFTSSFISQFERGKTKASVASLQKIASVLDINLSTLFTGDKSSTGNNASRLENPVLIRKSERSKLVYPDEKSIDYLLTGIDGQFEMIQSTMEPGGSSGELFSHQDSEEGITVLQGTMELILGDDKYVLNEGDTITFSSHISHGWKNTGSEVLKLIWVVSPPTY